MKDARNIGTPIPNSKLSFRLCGDVGRPMLHSWLNLGDSMHPASSSLVIRALDSYLEGRFYFNIISVLHPSA